MCAVLWSVSQPSSGPKTWNLLDGVPEKGLEPIYHLRWVNPLNHRVQKNARPRQLVGMQTSPAPWLSSSPLPCPDRHRVILTHSLNFLLDLQKDKNSVFFFWQASQFLMSKSLGTCLHLVWGREGNFLPPRNYAPTGPWLYWVSKGCSWVSKGVAGWQHLPVLSPPSKSPQIILGVNNLFS